MQEHERKKVAEVDTRTRDRWVATKPINLYTKKCYIVSALRPGKKLAIVKIGNFVKSTG